MLIGHAEFVYMLIFLHYYRKMKYFLFYNCLKVSSNPACFGEGFTRSEFTPVVTVVETPER
jgi:hypothetical protein